MEQSTICDDKKINKSNFYRKKLFKMDDVDVKKLLISKKQNHMIQKKTYLNILLDIITMMILDRYVSSFLKQLGMTNH